MKHYETRPTVHIKQSQHLGAYAADLHDKVSVIMMVVFINGVELYGVVWLAPIFHYSLLVGQLGLSARSCIHLWLADKVRLNARYSQ